MSKFEIVEVTKEEETVFNVWLVLAVLSTGCVVTLILLMVDAMVEILY
jgi:uncharacterized membrane protein